MITIGAKAHNLIRLRDEFGADVPPFVIVEFRRILREGDRIITTLESLVGDFLTNGDDEGFTRAAQPVLDDVECDDAVVDEVADEVARRQFGRVSFRTSALAEDGDITSFAGQYETFLDVEFSPEALRQHVRACLASLVSLRVLRYAHAQGMSSLLIGGSVIVQEMFRGTHSGVLFTESGSGSITVASTESWKNTVVEGDSATEYVIPRHELDTASLPAPVRRLARIALGIEARMGQPLDIEWAYTDDRVVLLQMRPQTVRMRDTVFDWDATNISENYPGITLPLTYSVIRELYAGVYPAFLRVLGTPEKMLRDESTAFRNMLGYLNGRVYYRITNWYELLKFLPGRRNQQFFEAMLNPVAHRGERKRPERFDAKSLVTIARFLWLLSRSESRSRAFKHRFAERLAFFQSYSVDFINAPTLIDASHRIRDELLADWATPILNDIKLMVFHGILKRQFFGDEHQAEYLSFLQGLTDRASLRPLEELTALGGAVRRAMDSLGVTTILALRLTSGWSAVRERASDYVDEFGARTPGELKLETVRLTDRIVDVLELALKAHESDFRVATTAGGDDIAWPAHVPWIQRPLLRWVAGHTRRAIDWRERFRFNRAQTFDLSRNLYDAIARTLVDEGLLDDERDIYWLTEQEIDEIVNGHAWTLDARGTVAGRKAMLSVHEKAPNSLAATGTGRIPAAHLSEVRAIDSEDGLSGHGVAPGELIAEVVVATEFDASLDVRGKILVVHHIDPGWTLLFTQAAGIIAERGNALSHAAIIAREIGIPAVVATPNATTVLATGDKVFINGTTGRIAREQD